MMVCVGTAAIMAVASPAQAATLTISDPFSRNVSGSWGSAPGGWRWDTILTSGSPSALSVKRSVARAHAPAGGSKSLHLASPDLTGNVDVAATFSVNVQPTSGRTNRWQVIARQTDIRTYYLMKLVPSLSGVAALEIQRAYQGVFTDLATAPASFVAKSGGAHRILARARTVSGGTSIQMRAWPTASAEPGEWGLSFVDTAPERLTHGRVGVRLSFTYGPARMTVDNVSIVAG